MQVIMARGLEEMDQKMVESQKGMDVKVRQDTACENKFAML